MKNFKRILALTLTVLMLLPAFTAWYGVSAAVIATLDGETSRTVKTLYQGVTSTNIKTSSSSKYETQNLNVIEFDLSQNDLYVDVTNGMPYANNSKTTLNTVKAFNANNGEGKTAIAAINGDLWTMNTTHSRVQGAGTTYGGYSDAVVTKSLTLPRGFTVYDGEIVCSSHMIYETPFEGEFWSFGVTDDSVPMIGCPDLEINISNGTVSTTADGLNRLPANNALVVYSDKGCADNYALSDAYEIVIEVDYDYKIEHGATITGEIIELHTAYHTTDPEMKPNRIILTARGTALNKLVGFAEGDTVTLDFSVTERYGRNTEGWQNVDTAVGGHMPFVVDGVKWETGTTNNYPSTIIGIKNDGNVVFITDDFGTVGKRGGLDFNDYWDFADDMDLNTAFILDGGGSTTLVEVNSSGGYSVTNCYTDTTTRSVVNSVILSAGPRKTGRGEYSVKTPGNNMDLTHLYFAEDDAYSLLTNFACSTLERTSEGAKLTVKDFNYFDSMAATNLSISYGLPNTASDNANSTAGRDYSYINAADYPYIVLDMKLVTEATTGLQFQTMYFTAGSYKGVSANTSLGFNNATTNNGFVQYILNPGANSNYKNKLNTLRIGYMTNINGVAVSEDDYMILRSAHLCKSEAEANSLAAALKAGQNLPDIQTVTLDPNGGECEQQYKYAAKNGTYGVMPIPERSGYYFDGWFTLADGGDEVTEDSTVTSDSARTLYAHWTQKPDESNIFNLYFDTNGGTALSANNYDITPGQTYEDAIGGMPDIPSYSGLTFKGWYNESYNYTLNLSDTFSVAEDITFKAMWQGTLKSTASSLNIRTGPGSSYESIGSMSNGTLFTVDEISGGWAHGTSASGITGWASMTYLASTSTLINEEVKGFEGLGTWDRVAEFNIDLNGGCYNSDSGITVSDVTASEITVDTSTDSLTVYVYHPSNLLLGREDYSFNTYLGCVYVDGEAKMVKAKSLGNLMNVILSSCTKTDYKPSALNFMGMRSYTPSELISADPLLDESLMYGQSYNWTAEWASAIYTLTLDPNGGVMPDGYSTSYQFRDDEKFVDIIKGYPVPTKEGYEFVGWQNDYYSPDLWIDGWGTQPYTYGYDISVTAVWEETAGQANTAELIEDENGVKQLYVDGELQKNILHYVDGDYYYADRDGSLVADQQIFVYYTNDLKPRAYYGFDAEGKLLKDGWLILNDEANRAYYFINGNHAYGLNEIDGNYYFFNTNTAELIRNSDIHIGANSYGIAVGGYYFDDAGIMQNPEFITVEQDTADEPQTVNAGFDNYVASTANLAINTVTPTVTLPTSTSDDEDE